MQDETERKVGQREKRTTANPSALSAPQTAPRIYKYTAQLGSWYLRAVVGAVDSNCHKPQSDKGSMSQAD